MRISKLPDKVVHLTTITFGKGYRLSYDDLGYCMPGQDFVDDAKFYHLVFRQARLPVEVQYIRQV